MSLATINKIRALIRQHKILIVILVIITLIRIAIALKLPLFLQADAAYDDFLFVKYARSLMSMKWLGPLSSVTLAKGCSFAVFLSVNYLLGIPYSFSLISLYIVSIIIFIVALKRIINNKYFLALLYSVLLYSPVMFHVENVQKVYRGGVIVCFALIISAGAIGLATHTSRKRDLAAWSILTSVALAFFWFLKEDSIWILPIIVTGIGIAIIRIVLRHQKRRSYRRNIGWSILVALLPILVLFGAGTIYKTINYVAYGEYTVTDRSGTYFKDVINDLISIEDENQTAQIWISRSMLEKAYSVSPTLSQIKEKMDSQYTIWSNEQGEIHGDIIYWVIKDAAASSGIYDNGGRSVNEYYRSVHQELTEAYNSGNLTKNNDFYISKIAKGINMEEVPEFADLLTESLRVVATYSENETGTYAATGEEQDIQIFNELTMSQFIMKGTQPSASMSVSVKVARGIVWVYQKLSMPIFIISCIVGVLLATVALIKVIQRKATEQQIITLSIMIGLLATCFALFFGTVFFCRFLSLRKVYDYCAGLIPLLQVIELSVIFVAGKKLLRIYRARKQV